jgi:succinate dehydrogenase/fumarate reductase cytochrome b subunit
MNRFLVRRAAGAVLAAATLAAAIAAATPAHAAGPATVLAVNDIKTVVDNATGWLMAILATVATFFLTVGGVRYVMAGGDPGEVEKAKSAFKSAGLGFALAALAPIVVGILKTILGVA